MSARITLGSTLAGLILLIIIGVVVITGSKANEENALAAKQSAERAEQQTIQNNRDVDALNKTFNNFVDRWQNRVNFSNQYNNATLNLTVEQERQLLNITKAQQKIFEQQLRNEQNIIGNLTDHREVTNNTRDEIIIPILNQTQTLIKAFNNTNEEERGKAVDNIIKSLHDDHIIIMKGLNITATDTNTESYDAIQKLRQQLEELEKHQPPGLSKNEFKGPKVK